jgi:hypothetical protein
VSIAKLPLLSPAKLPAICLALSKIRIVPASVFGGLRRLNGTMQESGRNRPLYTAELVHEVLMDCFYGTLPGMVVNRR